MNGAELLIKSALAAGVDVCFANPGTTEMPVVQALDSVPGVRGVLCLFEGVCTGAADGYARMAGKPALTLLHLGPGEANGVANLHNARRARTPIVNLIGDHASWHRTTDPPLNMDLEALDSSVSGWQRSIANATDAGRDMADAIAAAMQGQIATLIFPHDHQLAEADALEFARPAFGHAPVDAEAIDAAARLLHASQRPALILGGHGLHADGLRQAARIQAATGCALLTETLAGRIDRAPDLPITQRIPYFPEDALAALDEYDAFVLVDAGRPTAFFGYAGVPSYFTRDDQPLASVGGDNQDTVAVLAALADALDAPQNVAVNALRAQLTPPANGPLTVKSLGQTLAAVQPEGAIIINEGVTSGRVYGELANDAAAHTILNITGGAIGWGMPNALGAAIACPDRPVIDLQADGSGMYTLQALWTQAKERLNVTTLIAANRRYNILGFELKRAGITEPGPNAAAMIDLRDPAIDWPTVARGLGVPGVAVTTSDQLAEQIQHALTEPGPHLIEMIL